MKKLAITTAVFSALLLSGCSKYTVTEGIVAPDQTAVIKQQPVNPYEHMSIVNGQVVVQTPTPQPAPQNVKAVCRDGSYALELNEQTCLGHGGIAVSTNVYHAD